MGLSLNDGIILYCFMFMLWLFLGIYVSVEWLCEVTTLNVMDKITEYWKKPWFTCAQLFFPPMTFYYVILLGYSWIVYGIIGQSLPVRCVTGVPIDHNVHIDGTRGIRASNATVTAERAVPAVTAVPAVPVLQVSNDNRV